MATVDLTPLANAVARLQEGLALHQAEPAVAIIRDGLIQRFEFTYDLAHRTLRRALARSAADAEAIGAMSFPTLIRTAGEAGLVRAEWQVWRQYRDTRNITSHTYDEAKALEVLPIIPAFLADARDLVERLRRLET